MISRLTDTYVGFVTYIQQHDPLPTFAAAKSILELEESTILQCSIRDSYSSTPVALVANTTTPFTDVSPPSYSMSNGQKHNNSRGHGKKNNCNNNGGRNNGRGGRSSGRRQQAPWQQQWTPWQQWAAQWNMPPCPYPNYNWNRSNNIVSQGGILGPKPKDALNVNTPTPTDIENAIHTLNLAQPDHSWYMDTGATSHMTSSQGNLSSYAKLSKSNKIIVGILGENLYLVYVRKFTTDNKVSIEFDPFGFSLNDFNSDGNDSNVK